MAEVNVEVVQNHEENRFEINLQGKTALLEYMERKNTIVFPHTEVPKELEGQGLGKQLAETALGWAKEKGKPIVPICPFVASYIRRHPEYREMLAPGFIL